MKSERHTEMIEGQDAIDRFRKAMTTIVNVPKSRVTAPAPKPAKHKKATKP